MNPIRRMLVDQGEREGRAVPPDPEVSTRPAKRRFTTGYKLEILRKADACTRSGELGALLRKEGLYSSHLVTWRRQIDSRGPWCESSCNVVNRMMRSVIRRAVCCARCCGWRVLGQSG